MFELKKLIRKNIRDLKSYSSARDEFSGEAAVFLDANENPFGNLNRYPDPYQKKLKAKLSELKSIPAENIFIGNGSDELIELAFRIFCIPGKDKALTFSPTYGMYQVSADINDIELISLSLTDSFQINFELLNDVLKDGALKIIFICSPNNPTANSLINIDEVIKRFKGIVIVDEAYIDFSQQDSLLGKLENYPNLIVMQTLSKAWGLAAARIGIAYASREIISVLNKVKPPYNVSLLNQEAAVNALTKYDYFKANRDLILQERKILMDYLSSQSLVAKVYPSEANFILVEFNDADKVYRELLDTKLVTRNRTNLVKNCLRITIGSPEENIKLVDALRRINL